VLDLVGPEGALRIAGIRLVGLTAENGIKVLLTGALALLLWAVGRAVKGFIRLALRNRRDLRALFWSENAISLLTTGILLVGIISIWFDDPVRLATGFGLVSAGLAFALQRVITAVAGYFIILRGGVFGIGDRISMGGVRGDVISVGYTRTTVLEIGQPPSITSPDPAMWVEARQHTGRVVTVTNDKVFHEPVYNYSRDFPWLWEELHFPVPYAVDRQRAEEILREAADRHSAEVRLMAEEALKKERRPLNLADLRARVFYRLTENWLELTVRFIAREYGIRELKDAISRDVLAAFESSGIRIASATYEIVEVAPLRVSVGRGAAEAIQES
jgi:small-conductance mechanosensitive channel